MQNELVSIVLPIYNVEKYLNRCIESVVNQTYPHLEIILVDDGSPDRCPQICEDWAAKDKRIRVIHKKNAGLGMARNTGIEHAHGKYICFFDSDDYIALNTIELAYRQIKQHDAQIVHFGFHDVNADGKILNSHKPICPKPVYAGAEVCDIFLPRLIMDTGWGLHMSAWSAMFSMDLIHETGWRFVSERDILSEDIYSITALFKDVQRVAVLAEALYFYCRNDQSLTHIYRVDRFDRNVIFYQESLILCDRLGHSDDVKQSLTHYMLSNTIGAMKQLVHSAEPLMRKMSLMRTILHHEIWQQTWFKSILPHERPARRILLWCILKRWYPLCCLFCWLKHN